MQSRSPLFANMADLMTDAFSAAQAAGEEARSVFRAQAERMASELDLVSRDEFEAVKAQADAATAQVEALSARLEALEASAKVPTAKASAAKKPAAKKPAAKKPAASKTAAKKSSG